MKMRDLLWMVAVGLLLTGLALAFTMTISACGGARAIAHALTPPPLEQPAPLPPGASLDDQLKAARDARDAADIRISSLENQIAADEDKHTRRTLLWVSLICLLGFGGAVAALIWLPIGKRVAFGFAVAFAATGALSLVARSLVPYLPWIGLGLVGLLGLALLINARKILAALTSAVHFGVDMTAAETLKDAEVVKVRHLNQQVRAGVHDLISHTLAQVKGDA